MFVGQILLRFPSLKLHLSPPGTMGEDRTIKIVYKHCAQNYRDTEEKVAFFYGRFLYLEKLFQYRSLEM